jgi:hypothetical protein
VSRWNRFNPRELAVMREALTELADMDSPESTSWADAAHELREDMPASTPEEEGEAEAMNL